MIILVYRQICVSRFHTFNAVRVSETVPPGSDIPDEELYARPPPDSRSPRGWLVDLINRYILYIYICRCVLFQYKLI